MTRILKVEPMDRAPYFVPQYQITVDQKKDANNETLPCYQVERWLEFIGFDKQGNIGPKAFTTKEDAANFLQNPSIYWLGEFESAKVSVAE